MSFNARHESESRTENNSCHSTFLEIFSPNNTSIVPKPFTIAAIVGEL